ncbi:MAG: GAF domain-containing protein [Chloroflexi bacterium]|nr:GAF domain-containing protein [Chloroflexota bacterium]
MPIATENRWLGAILLQASAENALSAQTLQPFHTLAGQAATTLANQQLLRQAELLYQIGRSLSEALTREDALTLAVQEIANYTGAARCRIILYEEQEPFGKIAATTEPAAQDDQLQFPMVGDFVFDYLNEQRQPLLISSAEAEIPAEALARYLHPFHTTISLLIPLASQQDLIGFWRWTDGKTAISHPQYHLRPNRRRSPHHSNRKSKTVG